MPRRRANTDIHRPVVWVMGASRGIGREIAKQFASIGCRVCLSGHDANALTSAVKEILALGGTAASFPCNVAHPVSILATSKKIKKTYGDVDVLVNNAGITVFKSFLDTRLNEFSDIIDTNLFGHIACIKAVLPSMVKRKSGWIINILSNAAVKTFEGSAAYTATKTGMLGLGRVLREEMRQHGVKVVNVIPGATSTEMWSPVMRRRHTHRMMTAKSVAEAVLAAYRMPDDIVVDEMLIRPMKGDID